MHLLSEPVVDVYDPRILVDYGYYRQAHWLPIREPVQLQMEAPSSVLDECHLAFRSDLDEFGSLFVFLGSFFSPSLVGIYDWGDA